MSRQMDDKQKKGKPARLIRLIILEVIVIIALLGSYRLYLTMKADTKPGTKNSDDQSKDDPKGSTGKDGKDASGGKETPDEDEMTPEEEAALEEQVRLQKELEDRRALVTQADQLALGYNYDDAIQLLKDYQSTDGDYQKYSELNDAVTRLETEKSSLKQLGGSYDSVTKINHIFFHSLVADNSKAFDGDGDSRGYNMYMATVSEFEKIIQKMYEDGYVLVNISDLTKKVTAEDGSTKYEEGDIYLREGKKPFVISVDDVAYYEYMDQDGFASRIVLDDKGVPTCEMIEEDGSIVTGQFDVVPILDAFVREHPDFSYQGAKGLLALTGYEGILGYRTNDQKSPTYEQDVKQVKEVVKALKEDGWEFASHGWGHKNLKEIDLAFLKRDTNRWLKEVAPLIGGSDVLVFPYGVDFETTLGHYASDKFHFLKESGFNVFLGVYSKPWMHIKDDYVRMTRRPIDGQAMLEFPERLTDLFNPKDILDPDRPKRNW